MGVGVDAGSRCMGVSVGVDGGSRCVGVDAWE